MRLDVVLRYIGVVMLFIATFMLLSAGISYFNGMDSAFYPVSFSHLRAHEARLDFGCRLLLGKKKKLVAS